MSIVDLGIGVSSVEAITAGAASLPSPSDPLQYPPRGWLYVSSQPVWEKAESTGILQGVARFQFDIRAMRKIDKGNLFMVVNHVNITVGGSMQLTGRVRVLCKT